MYLRREYIGMSEDDKTDEMTYEEFNVLIKIQSFDVFRDEETFDRLRKSIHNLEPWSDWFNETLKSVICRYPESPNESSDTFETIYEGYLGRYRSMFSQADAEDAFNDFKRRMIEQDTDMVHDIHDSHIKILLEDKNPEDVFENPATIAKFKSVV